MDNKVYQVITDRIIGMLEKGTIPWRKPWRCKGGNGPANYVSGRAYHGINVLMLGCSAYSSRYWLTFKQALDAGGCVRKGEHGTPIVFWKFLVKAGKDETAESKTIPMLRYFTVFNADQCDDLPEKKEPKPDKPFDPIEEAEQILAKAALVCPRIQEHPGSDKAYYTPSLDTITLPARVQFPNPAHFYSTAFHETVHSTGHSSRLDRKEGMAHHRFGSNEYTKEELIAEMGAAMLSGISGIEPATIEDSAAYIGGWLRVLRDDVRAVVTAGGKAQKAVDYILGVKEED